MTRTICCVAVTLAIVPVAAGRSHYAVQGCGFVTGAPWTYHGFAGSTFLVTAKGGPKNNTANCAAARALVPGLTRQQARSVHAGPLRAAQPWLCMSFRPVWGGFCQNNATTQSFTWAAKKR
jgi:hypothetical protein